MRYSPFTFTCRCLIDKKTKLVTLGSEGRVRRLSPGKGQKEYIQIDGQGVVIQLVDNWIESQKLHSLNITIRHIRAKMGVLGEVLNGNWLPALPDGTQLGPKPQNAGDRHDMLYKRFAKAWRVSNETSLFDYPKGTTASTYTLESWPSKTGTSCKLPNSDMPTVFFPPIDRATAQLKCGQIIRLGGRENCIQDVMTLRDASIARGYIIADIIDQNIFPTVTKLMSPADQEVDVSLPVELKWEKAEDENGDRLTYKYYVWEVGETIDNNKAEIAYTETTFTENRSWIYLAILVLVFIGFLWRASSFDSKQKSIWRSTAVMAFMVGVGLIWGTHEGDSATRKIANLESGKAYFWKVIAEDGKGGTTESETYRFEVE